MRRRFWGKGRVFILAVLLLSVSGIAGAGEYPTKSVLLVNPVGPGGSHDLTGRALSSVAATYLGQPLIVQLKPGGSGSVGSEFVAKAAPDGYTLLFGGPGWSTTLPAVEGVSKGPDDLAAVCRINYSSPILYVRTDSPWKTLKELIDYAKANPDKLAYGHTGPWGAADVPWKQVKHLSGIKTKDIPHIGGGDVLMAILGGKIQVIGAMGAQSLPHVRAGKLRPLAVFDDKRDKDLPEIPTAKEQGYDVVFRMWRGVLAPKATPRPISEKLGGVFKQICEDKSFVSMIKQFGDEIHYLGPDEFTKVWRAEYETHKELGKIFKK